MSKQAKNGYSQSLFQHAQIRSTDHRHKKNRLHWVLEVRNGKDLLGCLVQLPAKAEGFFCRLFTQVF